MKEKRAQPSIATHAIEKQEEFEMTDVEIAYTLSAPWAAGTDTVSSPAFFE
jgi:hypothetical protein